MQGLGDAIKTITDFLNIKQCKGCIERQTRLNKWFPFKSVSEPTKEDIDFLTEVFSWYKGVPIPINKINHIEKCEEIYIRLFNIKSGSCKSCGSTYQNNYMKDLKRLWENSKI
jgi:hypothetical protein